MWSSILHIEGVLAGIGFSLLLFNKALGKQLLEWDGVDPRWSLVPIGLLFVWALLKANYLEFQRIEKAKNKAEMRVRELERPNVEQNRRLLYAAAIEILTKLMGERYRTHQVLLHFLWGAKFPNSLNGPDLLVELSRSTGKYQAIIEPSLFNSTDMGKMKMAVKFIKMYLWASENNPDFETIWKRYDLPDPDDLRSNLRDAKLSSENLK